MIPFELQPTIKRVLATAKTIAVVGLSPKSNRPSYRVASYLLAAGYAIIPVNPGQNEILGQVCYPSLLAVPSRVDIVDIFRRPADVMQVVEEAIRIRAETVWMQFGIINEEAAHLANQAGLTVIMDRCLQEDHQELFG